MAVGYKNSSGVDLDSIFEPRQGSDPAASNVGYQNSAGTDLAALYAPDDVGPPPSANTGYQDSAGVDIKNRFCEKGLRLTLSASGDLGSCLSSGGSCTATGTLTASASGGRSPYTFSWTHVSGPASLGGGVGTTEDVRHTNSVAGDPQHNTIFRCTVTDADGRQATEDVTFTCSHLNSSGGS